MQVWFFLGYFLAFLDDFADLVSFPLAAVCWALAATAALRFFALLANSARRLAAASWRALNRSTRPSVSMIFSSPVKNGCEALEMCTLTSG